MTGPFNRNQYYHLESLSNDFNDILIGRVAHVEITSSLGPTYKQFHHKGFTKSSLRPTVKVLTVNGAVVLQRDLSEGAGLVHVVDRSLI